MRRICWGGLWGWWGIRGFCCEFLIDTEQRTEGRIVTDKFISLGMSWSHISSMTAERKKGSRER